MSKRGREKRKMSIGVVLEQMTMIFILLLTGFFLYKKNIISVHASKDLSALVVNICSPGLVIVSMFNDLSSVSKDSVILVGLISISFYLFLIAFGYFLVKLLRIPASLKDAYVLMTVFGNVGFIGIPVALAIIGPESMVYVIVFNFFFNVFIFTFGIMLLKRDGAENKMSWKDYLSPGLVACLIAFPIYWFDIRLPGEVETLAGYYGNACTLLSMLVIGISLAQIRAEQVLKNKKLLFFVLLRFFVFPVLFALALKPLLPDLIMRSTVVLMAALPAGNMPAMLCEQYGKDPRPIAEGIIISTLLSVVSITVTFLFV